MSQSNSKSGPQSPKDSARAQRRRPDTSGEATNDEPEPACRSRVNGRSADQREWCDKPFTDGIREFYQSCEWSECFPDGPPDVDGIETIVRSARKPTVYHRPRETTNTGNTDHDDAGGQLKEAAQPVREPISAITELREGENIVWNGKTTPVEIVETTIDPSGTVLLAGSNSKYRLEGRPECARPFYIQHFGCQNEINRVVLTHGEGG